MECIINKYKIMHNNENRNKLRVFWNTEKVDHTDIEPWWDQHKITLNSKALHKNILNHNLFRKINITFTYSFNNL